jgi:hypothetical protein
MRLVPLFWKCDRLHGKHKQQADFLSLLISWAASLTAFWVAAHLFELGLGWFSVCPILIGLYVNLHSRSGIKRVLVNVFGDRTVLISKHFLLALLGISTAFYTVHIMRSFPSFTEVVCIVAGLAFALSGAIRLLVQIGVVEFRHGANS